MWVSGCGPDLMLENIPHIPQALALSEIIGLTLFTIFATIAVFHKYRWIMLRRFSAICGSVFFLRCLTMICTSLSVPGKHLDCTG